MHRGYGNYIEKNYTLGIDRLNWSEVLLGRISTRRNNWRFRCEIATKLFRHETTFNFHMINFDTIIENIIKNKFITFKNVKSNWE